MCAEQVHFNLYYRLLQSGHAYIHYIYTGINIYMYIYMCMRVCEKKSCFTIHTPIPARLAKIECHKMKTTGALMFM